MRSSMLLPRRGFLAGALAMPALIPVQRLMRARTPLIWRPQPPKAFLARPTTDISRATLWKITRTDGAIFCFTDYAEAITIGGLTFQPSRDRVSSPRSPEPSFLSGHLLLDASELAAGLFDFADVQVDACMPAVATMGTLRLWRGTLGSITIEPSGELHARALPLAHRSELEV